MATLIRVLGDFDLAEDAVQDAFLIALERWPQTGVPDKPGAWILTTARNRAIDRLRRERTLEDKRRQLALLQVDEEESPDEEEAAVSGISDDRLRLIFTCCHPALAPEARVALTLRTLGGLTTGEVASAFLVSEATMAQRLVRAKRKIRAAGIPYRVPEREELPERLRGVLATLYLVFNEGYAAESADTLVRRELCEEAIRLTRLLVHLMPGEPDVEGLLALTLLQHSRRDARVAPDGSLVLLAEQDRSLWDRAAISEAVPMADRALAAEPGGFYALQAAIAAAHVRADRSDWPLIASLYERLAALHPSPVVTLNRAVAVAEDEGPERGLVLLETVRESLAGYYLLPAVRADMLRRLGRADEAASEYRAALALAANPVEQRFLTSRLEALESP